MIEGIPKIPKRVGWFEHYKCGCVSKTSKFKKDLLGYCGKHGHDPMEVLPVYEDEDE